MKKGKALLGSRLGKRGGYILLEASVAYLILSLALVSLLPLFILLVKANKNTEGIAVATYLSTELMEEIKLRRWDEMTPYPATHIAAPSASLGIDSGENPPDKQTFDDLDDFNLWIETAPLAPAMESLPLLKGYRRTVSVRYVDSDLNPTAGASDRKQVTVCTLWFPPKLSTGTVCLDTVFTNR